MDYQSLGLGDAASIVTAVTSAKDGKEIIISCIYEPQGEKCAYRLMFEDCHRSCWSSSMTAAI